MRRQNDEGASRETSAIRRPWVKAKTARAQTWRSILDAITSTRDPKMVGSANDRHSGNRTMERDVDIRHNRAGELPS